MVRPQDADIAVEVGKMSEQQYPETKAAISTLKPLAEARDHESGRSQDTERS